MSHVSTVQVRQALVGQGRYREQENSRLEWPEHTVTQHRVMSFKRFDWDYPALTY